MPFKKIILPSALVLSFLLSFCSRAQEPQNKKLPASFTFYRLADSTAFTAADFQKTKKSMVIFFDATCEHCQDEATAIGKRAKEFDGVQIYMISMDDKQQVEKFMTIYGKGLKGRKNVQVLLDPSHEFLPKFRPERFPAIYIYSAKHELLWHKDGEREVDDLVEAIK